MKAFYAPVWMLSIHWWLSFNGSITLH